MSTTIDPLLQITPTPAPTTDRGAESGASFADELQRAQQPDEPQAAAPAKEAKPSPSDEAEDAEAEQTDEATAPETSGESGGEESAAAAVESESDNSEPTAEQVDEAEAPVEEQPGDTVELSEQAAAALGLLAEEAATVEQQAAARATTTAVAEHSTAETAAAPQAAAEGVSAAAPTEASGNKANAGQAATTDTTAALPAEAASEPSADGDGQGEPDQPPRTQSAVAAYEYSEPTEDSVQPTEANRSQPSAEADKQQRGLPADQEGVAPVLETNKPPAVSEATESRSQPASSVLQPIDTPSAAPKEAAAVVAEAAAPEAAPADATPKQNDAAGPPTIQRLFGERNAAAAQQPTEEPATGTVDRGRFVSRVANAFRVAQQRDGEIQLRLSPPQLGSLKITLTVQDGALAANLEAESPAARGVLLDNLPALRERLAEQEIRVEKFDVNVRDEGGGQPGDAPEGDHRNPQQPRQNGQAAGVEADAEQSATEEPSVGDDGVLDVRI